MLERWKHYHGDRKIGQAVLVGRIRTAEAGILILSNLLPEQDPETGNDYLSYHTEVFGISKEQFPVIADLLRGALADIEREIGGSDGEER